MKVTLAVIQGDQEGAEIPVSMPEFFIGRGEYCQLRAEDALVSRRHCLISVARGSATLEDCGSGKGTLLNGKKVQWRRELHNGDRITVGTLVLEVRLAVAENGYVRHETPRGRNVVGGTLAADDANVVRWVENEVQAASVGDHEENLSSPALELLTIQHATSDKVMTDTSSACIGQDRRIGRFDGHMAHSRMELIDLLLLTAIVALATAVVVLLLLAIPDAGSVVWRVCRAVVRFRQWPWWMWTTLGVLTLGVLLWFRERFE